MGEITDESKAPVVKDRLVEARAQLARDQAEVHAEADRLDERIARFTEHR